MYNIDGYKSFTVLNNGKEGGRVMAIYNSSLEVSLYARGTLKVFYGQEPPIGESTTTGCGVN